MKTLSIPPAPAIHADANVDLAEHACEGEANEVAALIRVEGFRPAGPEPSRHEYNGLWDFQ